MEYIIRASPYSSARNVHSASGFMNPLSASSLGQFEPSREELQS